MGWFRRTQARGDDAVTSFDARLAQIAPGVPGRCPDCDGMGYIDNIDIGHRYQIQHCTVCRHRWEYLFDAEGTVVGITDLDESGRPVARTRVRTARAPIHDVPPPEPPRADAPAATPDAAEDDIEDDVVLDLRDPPPAAAPAVEPDSPEQLSPAEWLRRSTQR